MEDPIMEALNDDSGADTATTESTPVETPTVEQKTTDESNATGSDGNQPTATPDGAQQGEESPEGDPKAVEENRQGGRPDKQTRINQRFGELTHKLKEKDEYIESLKRELAANMRQKPELKRDENGDTTVEDLIEYNKQQAEAAANDRVAELETRLEGEQLATRFDAEASTSLQKHPMLDPNSEQYNKKVAAAAEKAIMEKIGPHLRAKNVKALSRISPAQLIDEYMDGIYAAMETGRTQTTQNLNNLKGQSSGMFEGGPPPKQQEVDPTMQILLADD